ncbi:hypothetical protein [Algoriphagus sp. Y33]|uniref:hypothetical protein n=1 Tax=Algoriphagus sp. Y33 TaxID=2772483 RepID=UPI001782BD8E|nr:hypothetical protein [Algoriphagus sp. Y33]
MRITANDEVTADGLATVCLVLGEVMAKKMIEKLPEVNAFVNLDSVGKLSYWQSEGFGAEL